MKTTGRNSAHHASKRQPQAKAVAVAECLSAKTMTPTITSAVIGRKAGIAVSLAFGLFLLYGVGFAMPDILHNAAHDARHSVAFPCH